MIAVLLTRVRVSHCETKRRRSSEPIRDYRGPAGPLAGQDRSRLCSDRRARLDGGLFSRSGTVTLPRRRLMTMINTHALMCAVEALHAVGHKVEVGDAAVLPVDGQQLVMNTGLTDDQLRRARDAMRRCARSLARVVEVLKNAVAFAPGFRIDNVRNRNVLSVQPFRVFGEGACFAIARLLRGDDLKTPTRSLVLKVSG